MGISYTLPHSWFLYFILLTFFVFLVSTMAGWADGVLMMDVMMMVYCSQCKMYINLRCVDTGKQQQIFQLRCQVLTQAEQRPYAYIWAQQQRHEEFEQKGKIGSGGFSTVYQVRNKRDHQEYALKVVSIKPSRHHHISDYIDKVLTQVKVLSSLHHPNILRYHGCWLHARPYSSSDSLPEPTSDADSDIQMVFYEDSVSSDIEWIGGSGRDNQLEIERSNVRLNKDENIFGEDLNNYKEISIYILTELGELTLQKYVQQRNRMGRYQSNQHMDKYTIILDIIGGLQYVHSQSIIHRDLKLQNIIRGKDGKWKIIDFGLAKRTRWMKSVGMESIISEESSDSDQQIEKHSKSVGTKIFSSPEQTSSSEYDHRTDIYSLAMIICVLFSDYITVHEEKHLLSDIRNVKLHKLNLPLELQHLLIQCLGEQKQRPTLQQLKQLIVKLIKEELDSEKEGQVMKKIGKYAYLLENGRIKKRIPLKQMELKFNNLQLVQR